MSGPIVVSNRGPLSFRLGPDGQLVPVPGGGGLVSALRPLLTGGDATWVSVTMGEADRRAVAEGLMVADGVTLLPVVVDDDVYRAAYDVVANTTLWYLHHHLFDLPRRPRFDRHWRLAWDRYRTYNQAAADVVIGAAGLGATVLVQDYHFSLLGRMLAEARPDLHTVHFHHTPFADPNMMRILPDDVAGELLAGLNGFGSCGFHARMWEAGFRACFADPELAGWAGTEGRIPATFVAPLAPDQAELLAEASSPATALAAERLRGETAGRRLVVRVDRMEPTKNIVRGMLAFEELLLAHPEWQSEVVHLALAYPSRQGLADYLAYAAEVEHTAERINHALGTPDWSPIVLHTDDDRPRSLAALALSDVLLVNPVRDGLNLVAKEGPLLNAADGVLVLSRAAGSFEELGGAALGVNPFDIVGTAETLHFALSLDRADRHQRAADLLSLVQARTAEDWLDDQLAAAAPTA